jgi:chorismate mutase
MSLGLLHGGFMDGGNNHGGLHEMKAPGSEAPVHQVVVAACEELRQLLQQRTEIMKRIGTVKQTISGLANLFGEEALGDDLLELLDRKPNGRQPGFTKACRRVLMEIHRPLGAREMCAELERQAPVILSRHKDPLASVTTVLNRLVDYGEARSLTNERGRRVWEWVSDGEQTSKAIREQIPA